MLTRPKRPRTQSSESNETGPARKLTRLKEVDETGDRVDDSSQVVHVAAAGHTINAIGTSGMVAPDGHHTYLTTAGCGKTILSSSAIENVVNFCGFQSAARGYAYFFFDDTKAESESLSFESLTRSIITQLSDRCGDSVPDALVDLYNECNSGGRQPRQSQLDNTLSRMLEIFDSTFIIIDSLDQCVEKAELLKWIQSLAAGTSRKLHIMLTSRPDPEIERGLTSLHNMQKLSIGHKVTADDIDAYLDAQLEAAGMQHWNEAEKQMIKSTLSVGSFRWVALQVDAINKCKNKKELEKQLDSLPKGLDEIYSQIFERSEHPDYLEKLLQWLVFSERPVTVVELAEVLAIDFNNGDVPFYNPDLRCKKPEIVWHICNGFVTEVEGTIKLAHFSVQEYLIARIKPKAEAQSSSSEQLSHSMIAQDCLAQLLHFEGPSILDWEHPGSIYLDHINSLFPLAQYAAMNWVSHLHLSRSDSAHRPQLQKLLFRMFGLPSTTWSYALLSWVRLQNLAIDSDPKLRYSSTTLGRCLRSFKEIPGLLPLDASPLYYACFAGSLRAVQYLVNNGADVDKVGREASSGPLLVASQEGHLEIVRLLLDKGANANLLREDHGTALHAASAEGHMKVARLLLDKGADVNIEGGNYGTALQVASSCGHVKLAELLLERGADVDVDGGDYGVALHIASASGDVEIARLLLDNGANVNIIGGHYGTALQIASVCGHVEFAALLLDKGANVNVEGGYYGTALQAASTGGHVELARLLLDKEANVNARGGHYGTALQAASAKGHLDLAKLLLDKGGNVNIQGGVQGTALQIACGGRHIELAKLLLENGANVNSDATLFNFGTALQVASGQGDLDIVRLLLDNGADVNVEGEDYSSALQVAVAADHLEIVKLLLVNGANANIVEGNEDPPLLVAIAAGHLDLAKLLIDNGADVNVEGGEYGSALQVAIAEGHLELAKLLLDNGADVNFEGGYFGSALQAASARGLVEFETLLRERGAIEL
ncbi:hypothetical protein HWV62_1264 [Athelia sp. TMB]|nr:hypothetical protein HWV62_1264 [Athelia sp. TMB]